jgi:tight adherence protein C
MESAELIGPVLAVGLLVFLATLLILYGIFRRRLNLIERLSPDRAGNVDGTGVQAWTKRLEEVLIPIGEMLPRSPAEMTRQEKKLAQAGIRRKESVLLLNGAHVVIATALLLGSWAAGYLAAHPFLYVMLSILGGAAIPDIWLMRRISRRKADIQDSLPNFLDLTVVCIEAGLGLDQALMRVSEELRLAHPDFSDELRVRNLEVSMGRSRSEAFRNLAERTGVEDLKTLIAILIQTDRFGTSVGQAFRTFSDSLRTRRRQRAEEQAAKLAIKMILPMVLFIFPAVFIVILGPAVIAIVRDLLPALTGNQ